MAAISGAQKDLYRVLRVPLTATSVEIKESYRRLAMELHPDRNEGCEKKAVDFKKVTDAYTTLADQNKRRAYDRERMAMSNMHGGYQYGHVHYKKQTVRERQAHYRKVYTSRPPPGFGPVFNHERHYKMHYQDGIMDEEIERVRQRAKQAGTFHDYYESPLGKGFTIRRGKTYGAGPRFQKEAVKKDPSTGLAWQSATVFDDSESGQAARYLNAKDRILERMKERRKYRKDRTTNDNNKDEEGPASQFAAKEEGCIIM